MASRLRRLPLLSTADSELLLRQKAAELLVSEPLDGEASHPDDKSQWKDDAAAETGDQNVLPVSG